MKRAGTATPEQIAYLELRKKQIQQDQADAAQTLAIGAAKQAQLAHPRIGSLQQCDGWMDFGSIRRRPVHDLALPPSAIPLRLRSLALGGIMGSILGPMGSSMGGTFHIHRWRGQEGLQVGADMERPGVDHAGMEPAQGGNFSMHRPGRPSLWRADAPHHPAFPASSQARNPVDQIIRATSARTQASALKLLAAWSVKAGAQLATEGRINQPGQVLAEGLGEVVPGVVQVAGSTVVQRALKGDRGLRPAAAPQLQQPAPARATGSSHQMFPEAQKAPFVLCNRMRRRPPSDRRPSDDEVLHGAATPAQIAEMHPPRRRKKAADARAQGVQPEACRPPRHHAACARLPPRRPVSPESNPSGQIDAEPQVSTGNNSLAGENKFFPAATRRIRGRPGKVLPSKTHKIQHFLLVHLKALEIEMLARGGESGPLHRRHWPRASRPRSTPVMSRGRFLHLLRLQRPQSPPEALARASVCPRRTR